MTERVKPAEFARLMGWNRSTVTKLVQSGRLPIDNGLIDVESARRALADTQTGARPDVAARHAAARLQNLEKKPAQAAADAAKHPAHQQTAENGAQAAHASQKDEPSADQDPFEPRKDTLTAIKTERERIGLEKDRMELDQMRGDLMPRAEVEAALDDLVAAARQGLDNLPHAIAGSLVGLDFAAIHATLRDAIATLMRDMHAQAQRELADLSKGAEP